MISKERFRRVISSMAAAGPFFEKFGLDLGTDAIVAFLRERLREEGKLRPGATMRERVERLAYVLREIADGILELLAEIPAEPPTEEAADTDR